MRLIDADALVENLELMYEHQDDKDEPYNIGVRGAINMAKKAPTIEPKRGRWIPVDNGHHVRCSECGRCGFASNNFCPNCGADMREREGE